MGGAALLLLFSGLCFGMASQPGAWYRMSDGEGEETDLDRFRNGYHRVWGWGFLTFGVLLLLVAALNLISSGQGLALAAVSAPIVGAIGIPLITRARDQHPGSAAK